MKIFQKYVVLMLLHTSVFCFGQWSEAVDSLLQTAENLPEDSLKVARYGTLFEKLIFTDSDRALKFAKLENKLALKLDYKKGVAASNLHFGTYYENIGKIDSTRYFYKKAKEKFRAMNSLKGELFINHALASLEQKLGNFDEALRYFNRNIEIYGIPNLENTDMQGFNKIGAEYQGIAEIQKAKGNYTIAVNESLKALRFFEGIGHTRRTGYALKELGDIEIKRNNPEKALDYSLRAYQIFKDHDYNDHQSHTALDIGRIYAALNKIDSAVFYFRKALDMGKKFKFVDAEAAALINLGISYSTTSEYPTAKKYLERGIQLHRSLGFKNDLANDLNELSQLELKMNNPRLALELVNESIGISKNLSSLDHLSESYRIKSLIHERLGQNLVAVRDYKKFKTLRDSIFNTTKSQQIEELRTIYETEKKEQQIALQEQEIDLLEQKAKINNLQRILLGGGLGLSLLVFGFALYGVRQKMKRNRLEKEKVETELAYKKKELTTHALHLAKKNEVLEGLKQKATALKQKEASKNGYQQLIRTIDFDLQDDNNWQNFSRYFEEVHKDFNSNVKSKYPEVTSNELRLLALLKMNLSSKEIANILNISQEGIKKARYRLRKKLHITTEDSLQDLVLAL